MYRIIGQGFAYIKHQKVVQITLEKVFFFVPSKINEDHRVYFDLYDKKRDQQVFVGFVNIGKKDWIELGYKKRNKIKKLLENHFKSEFDIGNYRKSFEKNNK